MSAVGTFDPTSAYQPSIPPVNPKSQLNSDDFIKLLITQLQNQDPTKPVTNAELLGQVSQIGTLQSQQQLTSTLNDVTLQNQIASGSNLIGKLVAGIDAKGESIQGVVTAVRISNKKVTLSLDNGKELDLGSVSSVAPGQQTAAGDGALETTGS